MNKENIRKFLILLEWLFLKYIFFFKFSRRTEIDMIITGLINKLKKALLNTISLEIII